MTLTRVEAQRVLDKIDTQSDFPWKHELNYLRETVNNLFEREHPFIDKHIYEELRETVRPFGVRLPAWELLP